MEVIKRNGNREKVNLNKITERLAKLVNLNKNKLDVDHLQVATKVVAGLYDGVTTVELDNLAAETAAMMGSHHPDYDTLAARIVVSNLHKETKEKFSDKIKDLYEIGIISKQFYEYVSNNIWLDSICDYSRDFGYDYFGIKTLQRSYLLRDKDKRIIERPQDLLLRVAAFINQGDIEKTKETYELISLKYYTHATPTLFNAGTIRPQLSSCFLLDINDDSIDGIYKTLGDCAKISQSAGGIGLSVQKIRGKGSHIRGTGGFSNGIIPMLRVFDTTARYVDQGGGKRKGSFAIYLEPWHSDIIEFLDLKKNHGKEELRARDLFYGMWIPDLFMRRVEEDGEFTLFDPKSVSILSELYGKQFDDFYEACETLSQGKESDEADRKIKEKFPTFDKGFLKNSKRIKARDLWDRILASQIETGTPYMLYKDAANSKSNQQNLGTIKSSNLCTEIIEYTSPEETAVCNLASLSLPAFVVNGKIDYEKLYNVTRVVTRNLNKVIDVNYYPVKEAEVSNTRHRPVGIGVQGMADLFAILKISFTSEEAKDINRKLFEVIYKAAIDESIDLARKEGTYSSYKGSPASRGKLQFDLWGLDRSNLWLDWSETFHNLSAYGLRNSLLLAPMPTASTSQILGNNEAFEPFTSNIYTRRTLAGEFIVVNKHLVRELIELGLWSETLRQRLIAANGSVQPLADLPKDIKERYRTVWEMSMRDIIDMSADRGQFICQSQSLNLFVRDVTPAKLTSMHFYGWKKGLKTGMYYLRTEAAANAIQFTVVKDEKEKINENSTPSFSGSKETQGATCSIDDPNCESCSG
jgi:ribonucleoside-diphosphate reductase alpha chain